MSVTSPPLPFPGTLPVYRLSVKQYHQMIDRGILGEDDPVELLEGLLITKHGENPPYPLTVAQYHEMIRHGILKADDPVELLEGILVCQMSKNPPHTFATQFLRDELPTMMPAGRWFVSDQEPITTEESEPEPDVFVVRGRRREYLEQDRHPGPADMDVVIEVSESSIDTDRGTKRRIYARANVPQYWIVNLVDRRVEVYTDPSGPCDAPTYGQQIDYNPGDEVPVVLDGNEVGRIRVADLLV